MQGPAKEPISISRRTHMTPAVKKGTREQYRICAKPNLVFSLKKSKYDMDIKIYVLATQAIKNYIPSL